MKEAENKNLKFGIWIEPEIVNPKSELYEKHPDWILKLPNIAEDYQRNQLVLDLANPEVQGFVFGVVDKLMTGNPKLAYFKWNANRYFSNEYSQCLAADNQSHVYVDYVHGLYKVLDRLREKYPYLHMMPVSGGGGAGYGVLRYFKEFWPSDNTNPLSRVFT